MEIDEISMRSAHSIIMGNKPSIITPLMVNEKISKDKEELQKFGLFDNATPNYTTYYPEVTAEDLNPKDDEFIQPVYRLLSEVIVNSYDPVDFSKPGVLKASMPLLLGQTINIDHEIAVGNAIGSVKEVFWQESYKIGKTVVPAGINGVFLIDGKSNPRIARGINMNPPSIHSNSVTIRFAWEQSHPDMDRGEFMDKIGTYDSEGKLIRKVAAKILGYRETSLVSHGADPYAKKVDASGKMVGAHIAHQNHRFSDQTTVHNTSKSYFINYKVDETSVETLSAEFTEPITPESNTENTTMNKELALKLATLLGLTLADDFESNQDAFLTEVIDGISTLKSESDKVTTLTDEKTALETKVTQLEGKITKLETEKEELGEAGKYYNDLKASEVASLTAIYKLAKGDKAEEEFINSFKDLNPVMIKQFKKTFEAEVDEKIPLSCKDCGSTQVNRASANPGTSSPTGGKELSNIEKIRKLREAKNKKTEFLG